jgi:hypothetical protein
VTFGARFPWIRRPAKRRRPPTATCNYIGWRVYDLAVWHFGDALIKYCQDKASGARKPRGVERFASHGMQ